MLEGRSECSSQVQPVPWQRQWWFEFMKIVGGASVLRRRHKRETATVALEKLRALIFVSHV